MFHKDFFGSPVWRQLALNYAKTNGISAPVAEFTLTDGTSFNVKSLRTFKTCVAADVYGEQDEIQLRLVPYENIKYITFMKGTADGAGTLELQKGSAGPKK